MLLYVNEPLIEKLGTPFGVGMLDFINALNAGPEWATRQGFCQKAVQALEVWRPKDLSYPPYIAYLACFVLAAGTEGDFAPHAYYPRLNKLLGRAEDAGGLPSFDRMIELWDDLEKWSKEDQHEQLGRFEARIRGSWWKVGLPLSQTIISEDERRHLPNIFDEAGLDPVDSPAPEVIIRILRKYGEDVLEKRTRQLLTSEKKDDLVLKNALINVVLDELEEWDGTVLEDLEQDATETARRRTHAGLRICLAFDTFARTVKCYVRFKTGKTFPEDGLNFTRRGDSNIWSCNESCQGWSTLLKNSDTKPAVKLDGASLDWVEGVQLNDADHHWRAKLRGATTRLFLSGKHDGFSEWIEKQRLERGMEFYVAAYGKDIETVMNWGRDGCQELQEESVTGLPAGWKLFHGKNALKPCPSIDALSVSSSARLLLRGGIKTGMGNTYLAFAPPDIVIDNGQGNEAVTVNKAKAKRFDGGIPVWCIPAKMPVGQPLHVEVASGEYTLKRMLRLEEPHLPLSFDKTPRRDSAGNFCKTEMQKGKVSGAIVNTGSNGSFPPYPKRLPLHLSSRITFVGSRPGQFARWPSEELPRAWKPVWAIARMSRKISEAVFCGNMGQAADNQNPGIPLEDRKAVREWKEIVYYNRKVIDEPVIPQIRDMWRKYVKAAQNV